VLRNTSLRQGIGYLFYRVFYTQSDISNNDIVVVVVVVMMMMMMMMILILNDGTL